VPLNAVALRSVLAARVRREQIERYQTELIYLLVKRHYDGVISPGEYVNSVWMPERIDKRDSKTIVSDMVKKLGG